MTTKQLIEKLQELDPSGEDDVVVHSFGGIGRFIGIQNVSLGFDWNRGAIVLHPSVTLTIYAQKERKNSR